MRFPVTSRLPAWACPLALCLLGLLSAGTASAAAPTRVTLVGDFQSELGCPSDNDTACTITDLTYDATDDAWHRSFTVPAGTWAYRVAVDGGAGGTYGKGATLDGEAITVNLPAESPVKFYFDHTGHWAASYPASTAGEVIATAPGSFQSELGCSGDWQPDCLRSWLKDPDGDGIYTFTTTALPEGNYETKVTINESWGEHYGEGGISPGDNINFLVHSDGAEVSFRYDSTTHIMTIAVAGTPPVGNIQKARAHWVSSGLLVWDTVPGVSLDGANLRLHYDSTGAIELTEAGISGGQSLPLTLEPLGLPAHIAAKFPHLQGKPVLKLADEDLVRVEDILKGQIALSATDAQGALVDATSAQLPGVLDELYANDAALGVTWADGAPTLRLWAPTARNVKLLLFTSSDPAAAEASSLSMQRDPATGVWSITGDTSWKNQFYLYEVEVYVHSEKQVVLNRVTDPYSLSLTTNSLRSQIIDLDDPALAPPGWDTLAKPSLEAPEDIVIYELHVRDFSINDRTVPAERRGTFLAFTEQDSNGVKHLRRLAQHGLTHVHLLPVFDIATINEDRSQQVEPAGDLAAMAPDSQEQQAAVGAVKDLDGFNWGYDPFHFTVPEGSYATNPDGPTRILEFRRMVQALAQNGLRTVLDVVYNHTHSSGQSDKSVLDKVVPGYYHRLSADGRMSRSTCCENTATEHAMMEKLMVDSLVTWTRAYKVDGFRFDLMGHHMKANMEKVRDRLRALSPEVDQVDGSKLYLYGEGWNFGEVADNVRGVNATQLNMTGTGIGTFSDRLRDAVRGGSAFGGLQEQGFINGLWEDPNGITPGTADEQRNQLLVYMDRIRVGLAGNLRDYTLVDRNGQTVTGAEMDYYGQPTGYTEDPQEVITYISKHDNETLFDIVQLKAPEAADVDARVRMHNLGVSLVALGQGIPFFHAGVELLRSKSMDRNSYNSGDWFNKLDYTYESNNWGVGLPPAGDNESKWPVMQPLLANAALKPGSAQITRALDHFEEMVAIRKSTALFRLRTKEEVQAKLRFLNTGTSQVPGLIIMNLRDAQAADGITDIVVLFNATLSQQVFNIGEYAGTGMRLHPIQANSTDTTIRQASFDQASGGFLVPARSTAVFVNSPPDTGEKPGQGCGGCSGGGAEVMGALSLLMAGVLRRRRRSQR